MAEIRVDPIVEETIVRLGLNGVHADAVRRNLAPPVEDAAAALDAFIADAETPSEPGSSDPPRRRRRRSPVEDAALAPPTPKLFDRQEAVATFRRDLAALRHAVAKEDETAAKRRRQAQVDAEAEARAFVAPRGPQRVFATSIGADAAAPLLPNGPALGGPAFAPDPMYEPSASAAEAAQTTARDECKTYRPTKTMAAFHRSDRKVRALLGPVGSGKSTACVMEILSRAMRTPPVGEARVRHSRWLVARSTFSELKSTTIKTFMYWLGAYGSIVYGSPITFTANQPLPDGTTMLLEVEFLPLDGPDAIARLRSLEITGAWLNEASLMSENLLVEIIGRLRFLSNEYPRDLQPWRGVIIDSNMPDTRHWLYAVFENERPAAYELFKQPGALILQPDGTYTANPEAENVDNLPNGYQYYFDMVTSPDEKVKRKIAVLVLAEYGAVFNGKPVYDAMWRQREHVSERPLEPTRHLPLIVGLDFGLNPAAVFMQQGATGGLLVLDECAPADLTLEDFIVRHLRPKIAERFSGMTVICVGDPAGVNRSALAKMTAFQTLQQAGFSARPAFTNAFQVRRDAVGYFLNRRDGFLIDKRCSVLIEGFNGGYCYKKTPSGSTDEVDKRGPYSHPHDGLQYGACYFYRPQAFSPRASTSASSVTTTPISGDIQMMPDKLSSPVIPRRKAPFFA